MIETYLLRGLAEIERTGSFTAAAKALFVSQPALSRAMQKLEGELGVALFDRSGGRTSLAPLGRLAAEHARAVLAALDGMAAAVREADRARRVFRYGAIAPARSRAPAAPAEGRTILQFCDDFRKNPRKHPQNRPLRSGL